MMTLRSKRELLEMMHPRYLKASKARKTQILDEFIAATGYHRKYAIRVLKRGLRPRGLRKKSGRQKVYQGEVVGVLKQIWEILGRICSKRLKPFLPEMVEVLERCKEIEMTPETKTLLLKMSCSTIDRCLRLVRFENKKRGLSTTKPGTLLKNAIPIRTFTEWDDAIPGFVEIDLVAHCGETTAGQYLNTLTVTDIATGWTECLAILYRSQEMVSQAIIKLRQRLPFPLLGIDSDNGSEFINHTLFRYCEDEEITFTRCRPYKKNDQAHVEQKNWSVVRRLVGYDRFETEEELILLSSIYDDWRLYVNFFQPVLKLVAKERLGSKVKKMYDIASTPYRRVLATNLVSIEDKARLINIYYQLNPVTLRKQIDDNIAILWKLIR
ncbi:MAG: ISNCY family transposase [Anaerolineaceae bacterium]|nr:ISNCY family transposase [Anaerolineaceae bacterium]